MWQACVLWGWWPANERIGTHKTSHRSLPPHPPHTPYTHVLCMQAWRPLREEDRSVPGFSFEGHHELMLHSKAWAQNEWYVWRGREGGGREGGGGRKNGRGGALALRAIPGHSTWAEEDLNTVDLRLCAVLVYPGVRLSSGWCPHHGFWLWASRRCTESASCWPRGLNMYARGGPGVYAAHCFFLVAAAAAVYW